MRFFISYSRSVRTDVIRIVELLQAKGHEVWWDADIPPGQAWWSTILDKIEWCEVFVFVVSEKSVQSPYCLAELKYATDRNRPILPFIIDPPASYVIPAVVTPKLNQWLPYDGKVEQATQDIIEAAAGLDQSLYMDLPGPRPPEPGKDHKTLTNQFQQALTLADEGHFEEALKHFREVDALDHKAWGDLCRTWIAKIVAYVEVADLADHHGTLRLARTRWKTYAETYTDEDGLFDPLNLARTLVPTTQMPPVQAISQPAASNETSSASAPLVEPRTKVGGREGQRFSNLMKGVSALVFVILALLIVLPLINPPQPQDDTMIDRSIPMATEQITPPEQTLSPLLSNTPPNPTDTVAAVIQVDPLPTKPLPLLTTVKLPIDIADAPIAFTPVVSSSTWDMIEQDVDGVAMVLVPAGCFTMGGSDFEDEKPQHSQCFETPFWIDKYEVTNAQFALFSGSAEGPSTWPEDDHPRESLTWFEARDFCALRGARLPTEREWEYAARGPDSAVYPWGNTWEDNRVVWHGNSNGVSMAVGSYPEGASWVGALDMSGNVWEWVSTVYGIETQGDSDFTNDGEMVFGYPYVADDGREQDSDEVAYGRVFRGGSWMSAEPNNLRSAYRGWLYPGEKHDYIGFRCVRDS